MTLKEAIIKYQKLNTIIDDLNHSISNDDNLEEVTIDWLRAEVIKLRTEVDKFNYMTVVESQPCQPTISYIVPQPNK